MNQLKAKIELTQKVTKYLRLSAKSKKISIHKRADIKMLKLVC